MTRAKQDVVRTILGEIATVGEGVEIKARARATEYATEASMVEPGRSMFVEHYVNGTMSAHARETARRIRDVIATYLEPRERKGRSR